MHPFAEAQAFCLPAARTVNKPFNQVLVLFCKLCNYGCIRSCRRQYRLGYRHIRIGQLVGKLVGPAVYEFFVDVFVECFGIFFCVVFAKHIVARACKPVRAYAAVFESFVSGPAKRSQTYNSQSGLNRIAANYRLFVHNGNRARVYRNGARYVARVGGFAAAAVDFHAVFSKRRQKFLRSVYKGGKGFAVYVLGVPV